MLQRITVVVTFPSIPKKHENERCSIREKWFHSLKYLQIIPAQEVADASLLIYAFCGTLV